VNEVSGRRVCTKLAT